MVHILFDIDGTLLDAGGEGRKAMEEACRKMVSPQCSLDFTDFLGTTDASILQQLKVLYETASSPFPRKDAFVSEYGRILTSRLRENPPLVLPGVITLLESLDSSSYTSSILSGNLTEGGNSKLATAGIDHFFTHYFYGDTAIERQEIVACARESLDGPLVIIGDTPRDIEAAHYHDIPVLAVSTGHAAMSDVVKAGADMTLPDLSDTSKVLDLLKDLSQARSNSQWSGRE